MPTLIVPCMAFKLPYPLTGSLLRAHAGAGRLHGAATGSFRPPINPRLNTRRNRAEDHGAGKRPKGSDLRLLDRDLFEVDLLPARHRVVCACKSPLPFEQTLPQLQPLLILAGLSHLDARFQLRDFGRGVGRRRMLLRTAFKAWSIPHGEAGAVTGAGIAGSQASMVSSISGAGDAEDGGRGRKRKGQTQLTRRASRLAAGRRRAPAGAAERRSWR